jgi:hypothetical protein
MAMGKPISKRPKKYILDGRSKERAAEKQKWRYRVDPEYRKRQEEANYARTLITKKMSNDYKLQNPCACGETDPTVLGFRGLGELTAAVNDGNLKVTTRLLGTAQVACLNCLFGARNRITTENPRSRKIREYLATVKAERGCYKCGHNNPLSLLFHHVDERTKFAAVSVLVKSGMDAVRAEIEKCQVLCFNCHLRHHLSNGWGILYDIARQSGFKKPRPLGERYIAYRAAFHCLCKRCGKHWDATVEHPVQCKFCHSDKWDQERPLPKCAYMMPFAVFNGLLQEDGYELFGRRVKELRINLDEDVDVVARDPLYDTYTLRFKDRWRNDQNALGHVFTGKFSSSNQPDQSYKLKAPIPKSNT